jgi:hypothetical protein
MTTKLAKMPYAQAHINRYDSGEIELVSYATTVAAIDRYGWVTVYGLYSATTRRHLSAFAAECCDTGYYTLKTCYTDGLLYNIHTKRYCNPRTGLIWTA